MTTPDWEASFLTEIEQAQAARRRGKEGMARVCARRAAGIAVQAYFNRRGLDNGSPSAVERLKLLIALPETPEAVREIARYFLIHVTPEYALPIDVDLLEEAQKLRLSLAALP
jgi:hypothetical protein